MEGGKCVQKRPEVRLVTSTKGPQVRMIEERTSGLNDNLLRSSVNGDHSTPYIEIGSYHNLLLHSGTDSIQR